MHTERISNSAIMSNDYIPLISTLCARIQVNKVVSQKKSLFMSDWFEVPRKTS